MVTTTDLSSSKPAYGLKRLGFVRDYSGYYWTKSSGLASHLYNASKQYAPASLQPRIKAVEDKVAEYSHPALTSVQDRGDSVLHTLDAKVDYAAALASRYYSSANSELTGQVQKQKEYHRENLERYNAARDAYLQKIEDTVGFVKQHGVAGTAKYSADAVLARVEEAKRIPAFLEKQGSLLATKVNEAWNNFYHLPAVQDLLAKTRPSVDFAWKKYLAAHDQVLSTSYYHKAVDQGSKFLNSAQSTSLYQNAKVNLYPSIAAYADPAYEQITSNSYYKAAVNHLKPVSPYAAKSYSTT